MRKGASFETVLNNIKLFWALRNSDEFINHNIRVSISGVKVLDSQNEEEFSKFWSSYCDDAYLNPAEERWDTYFNSVHQILQILVSIPGKDCMSGTTEH